MQRLANVSVIEVEQEIAAALTAMARRTMRLACTIQEGQVWLASEGETFHFEPLRRK
jgi:uncharacterized protein YaeQ